MDSYAVIGNPVAHSKSPQIHAAFAQQTHQNMIYTAIKAPLNEFAVTIREFEATGGKGCNVTLPFKEQAYQIATHHSELAKQSAAANTLVFRENHQIYADSTDGPGLVKDITDNHHYSLQQKNILMIGAGGAAKCIVGPLLAESPAQLLVANRAPEKALMLAKRFAKQGEIKGTSLQDIPETAYDLIINATSASVTGHIPNISEKLIDRHTWCYDLFYSQESPAFLKWAKHCGAERCIDGLGMLVEQAALSFYLWHNVYPKTKPIIEMLKKR